MPKNLLPADFYSVRPAQGHASLVFMLVLTQLSVGAFAFEIAMGEHLGLTKRWHAGLAFALGLLALAGSVLHLGRPLYAFRAVLGLGHSWLSREIVAFGLFASAALAHAALTFTGSPEPAWLGGAVVVSGVFAVFCSVMVYHVTRRRFWNATASSSRFFGTAAVLGAAMSLAVTACGLAVAPGSVSGYDFDGVRTFAAVTLAVTLFKLLVETAHFRHLLDRKHTDLKRSALLMRGELSKLTWIRFGAGAAGGTLLPLLLLAVTESRDPDPLSCAVASIAALALLVLGEAAERTLFFRSVAAPRMPGVFG